MNKRVIALSAVAAVVVVAVIFTRATFRSRSSSASDVLKLSGNIEVNDVELSFNIPGKMAQRVVSEGMAVKAGQDVARLDTQELEQELELRRAEIGGAQATLAELTAGYRPEEIAQAEAALARTGAEAARAEAELIRQRGLREQDVISSREFEVAEATSRGARAQREEASQRLTLLRNGPRKEQIDLARERVRQAEAAHEIARTRLEYTTLVSPLSGQVLADHVEPGERVAAGTPVVTVADLGNVWLRGFVDETDLGRVKVGQPVRVTTDSRLAKTYEGRVSFIAQEAEFTPKSVQTTKERVKLVYRIKVDIPNPGHELKPGMPADADILVGGE